MLKLLSILVLLATAAFSQTGVQITVGPESPSVNLCQSIQTGNIHVRTQDPANGPIEVLRCTQTGSQSYAWLPIDHFVGGTLPAKCTVGAVAFKTGVTAGQNVYGCTAAGTWTIQGGVGASPGGSAGQVQYYGAGGFFLGDSGLAYNDTTKSLGVIGAIVTGQSATGTGSILFNGLTSGTVTLKPNDVAGTVTITLPATTGTVALTSAVTATGSACTITAITAGIITAATCAP